MIDSKVVQAVLRHVYTAVGAGVTVAGIIGLSASDGASIMTAVQKIGDSVVAITTALGVIVPVIMATWAGLRSTKTADAANIVRSPDLDLVPLNATGAKLIEDAKEQVKS